MDLILVRHGDAERTAPSDHQRALTDKGKGQAERLGRCLASCNVQPAKIITSPLKRAQQTAQLLGKAMASADLVQVEERLSCGMRPEDACEILSDHGNAEALLLVGHEPDLSTLCTFLSGSENPDAMEMKKGSCAAFMVEDAKRRRATLKWLLPPQVLSDT